MRQGDGPVAVAAHHGFIGDHGIDHRLFRRLDDAREHGIEVAIRQGFECARPPLAGAVNEASFAVEKARKISPEPLLPTVPVRASPIGTRRARRLS